MPYALSHFFEGERYALPHSDTHGGKRKLPIVLLKAVHGRQRQSGTRHAERMTERDRASMRIDVCGGVSKSQLPQAG
jgi:hypothetical protein